MDHSSHWHHDMSAHAHHSMNTTGVGGHNMSNTTSAMDHSGHSMHGHNHGGGSCLMSMYWNWYTKDACFLSKSWKIGTAGQFGLTCLFIIFLVVALEFIRRMQREFDRYVTRDREEAMAARGTTTVTAPATTADDDEIAAAEPKPHACCGDTTGVQRVHGLRNNVKLAVSAPTLRFRPTLMQQLARALLYTLQFGVGYLLMLFVMYYNGYLYFCMLIGAFIGFFLFSWDNLAVGGKQEATCC